MHLTLKFFGDVDTTRLSDIEDALTRSAAGVGPFALKLQGAGTFPLGGPAAPRVLWLGVEDVSGGLAELRQRFERECEAAGFAREARPFRPHLTLGRVRVPDAEARRAADAHRVLGLTPVAFVVTEVCLVRSELGPGGSRYSVCARQVLAEESGESDHPRVTSDRRRE